MSRLNRIRLLYVASFLFLLCLIANHKTENLNDNQSKQQTDIKIIKPLSLQLNDFLGDYVLVVPDSTSNDLGYYDQIQTLLRITKTELEYNLVESSDCNLRQYATLGNKEGEIVVVRSWKYFDKCQENSELKSTKIFEPEGKKVNFRKDGNYLFISYGYQDRLEKFFKVR